MKIRLIYKRSVIYGHYCFNGKSRKNSNTDILLDEMIKGAKEAGHNVIKYCVSDLNISAVKVVEPV